MLVMKVSNKSGRAGGYAKMKSSVLQYSARVEPSGKLLMKMLSECGFG